MSEPIIYTSYRDDNDEESVSYQRMEQEGEEALARYRQEKEKEAEELLKKYREQRAEALKNSKKREQPVEQPKQGKPKKSWIKNLFSKIIDFFTNEGNLDVLLGIFYIFWFGFVGRIIIISDIHVVFKIIMIAGDLFLALYMFVQHHNSNKE